MLAANRNVHHNHWSIGPHLTNFPLRNIYGKYETIDFLKKIVVNNYDVHENVNRTSLASEAT